MLCYSLYIISIMLLCQKALSYQAFHRYSIGSRSLMTKSWIVSDKALRCMQPSVRQLSMVEKSEKEWKSVLTPNQFSVLRLKATGQQYSFLQYRLNSPSFLQLLIASNLI
jgi:hypothetical protein